MIAVKRAPAFVRRSTILTFLFGVVVMAGMLTPFMFGPHAYDANDMIRKTSDGNLTATANLPASTGLTVDSTGIGIVQFIRVYVPQATGTTPTADLVIQDSPDGSTWKDRYTFDQITAAGTYRGYFTTKQKYVRVKQTIGGTTPNFGAVQIGFETGAEYKG